MTYHAERSSCFELFACILCWAKAQPTANGFIRRSAIKRPKRLELKWSLSKVSDFLGQDHNRRVQRICTAIQSLRFQVRLST